MFILRGKNCVWKYFHLWNWHNGSSVLLHAVHKPRPRTNCFNCHAGLDSLHNVAVVLLLPKKYETTSCKLQSASELEMAWQKSLVTVFPPPRKKTDPSKHSEEGWKFVVWTFCRAFVSQKLIGNALSVSKVLRASRIRSNSQHCHTLSASSTTT